MIFVKKSVFLTQYQGLCWSLSHCTSKTNSVLVSVVLFPEVASDARLRLTMNGNGRKLTKNDFFFQNAKRKKYVSKQT